MLILADYRYLMKESDGAQYSDKDSWGKCKKDSSGNSVVTVGIEVNC